MTNNRRAELLRAMESSADDEAVLFINGWGAPEITCGEMRELLTRCVDHPDAAHEIVCLECVDSQPIICAETGDHVDDCHCIDVRDYDADDAADDIYQQALDERGGQD